MHVHEMNMQVVAVNVHVILCVRTKGAAGGMDDELVGLVHASIPSFLLNRHKRSLLHWLHRASRFIYFRGLPNHPE
jgi:hypothetical protein